MSRLDPPVICLVTDRRRLPSHGSDDHLQPLLSFIEAAAAAGIDLVQVRENDLPDRVLFQLVRDAVDRVAGSSTRIVVNDRVDVALSAGAAGVHLKSRSMSAERVRPIVPNGWLIGRSVHERSEACSVTASGALDYLILGPVFRTPSKPGSKPLGIEDFEQTARMVQIPTLAIGGVTTEHVGALTRAGAGGFAAIGEFVRAADDLRGRVQRWRDESAR